jgi:uncharacterized protein
MASATPARPIWADLSSGDPEGSRAFYSKLFSWHVEPNPDPQYGGYAVATLDGKDVAGIGPKMMAEAPTAWLIYIGTPDANALADAVTAAGGTVVAPVMDVGPQGRMGVFQDPSGAVIGAWQPGAMAGFSASGAGSFGWPELNSRGVERAIAFYREVFGWSARTSPMGEGQPDYTEFLLDGESIAGGQEMQPMVPAQVPSYWLPYFTVADVDGWFRSALDQGAREMVAPMDFPGGRFAILQDPQGATFGLLKTAPRQG